MRSTDLTRRQAVALTARVQKMLDYITRLCSRMESLGFLPEDKLVVAARRARADLQDVYDAALRAGIKHGMGADPDTKEKDIRRA